jgi:glycosyltransferase involved in cell wall biosynthesis
MPVRKVGRRVVGIWTEWETELSWTTEGLARLIGFLVEGAAARNDLTFCLVVTPANYRAARDMLSGLAAREGEHWALYSLPPIRTAADSSPAADCTALPQLEPPLPEPSPPESSIPEPPPQTEPPVAAATQRTGSRWLLSLTPSAMRIVLVGVSLMALPVQLLRILLRPIWRYFWRHGLSAVPVQFRILANSVRDPVAAAGELGARLKRAPLGLAGAGVMLQQWSLLNSPPPPEPPPPPPPPPPDQADFANAEVEVDGWLLVQSNCVKGLELKCRRVALFADAIPLEFGASFNPGTWAGEGVLPRWWHDARHTLSRIDGVITFSKHVARRHVAGFFGVDSSRIRTIPHAPADLIGELSFIAPGRRRTLESRRAAADRLRCHAADRDWAYLVGFPFDDIDYVAISTQDRPTKNLPLVVDAIRRLIRRDYYDIKLFMTTILGEVGESECILPSALRDANLQLDTVSMPRLPGAVHAAFYHCAAVTVHPSLFEGGATVFPFGESVSVGTPCLMARGPHTEELLESYPELHSWVFDPYDVDGLARLIRNTIADRDAVLTEQLASYARMKSRSWAQVADEYADAVTGSFGQIVVEGVRQ